MIEPPGSLPPLARRLLLVGLSVGLVAGYFLLPPNHDAVRFLAERCRAFPGEWRYFRTERDPERRLERNYGMNYDGPMFVRDHLKSGDCLQLPPRRYLSRYYPPGQDAWAEPRFIYYVAGRFRTLAWKGAVRPEATAALVVDTSSAAPELRIVDLRDPEARRHIDELYQTAAGARP